MCEEKNLLKFLLFFSCSIARFCQNLIFDFPSLQGFGQVRLFQLTDPTLKTLRL